MERIKRVDYSEEEVINGITYRAKVITCADLDVIEDVIEEQNLTRKQAERLRHKLLLTKSIQMKVNGEWQNIGLGYFNTIPVYEYNRLLSLFHRVNSITDNEINNEDSELLFEAMRMFGRVDFNLLDGLSLPQKEWLRAQIARRKQVNGGTD